MDTWKKNLRRPLQQQDNVLEWVVQAYPLRSFRLVKIKPQLTDLKLMTILPLNNLNKEFGLDARWPTVSCQLISLMLFCAHLIFLFFFLFLVAMCTSSYQSLSYFFRPFLQFLKIEFCLPTHLYFFLPSFNCKFGKYSFILFHSIINNSTELRS